MESNIRNILENFIFYFVLLIFSILVIPQLSAGISSGDAYGIIDCINRLLKDGQYISSRPPGHPASELFFLFPIAAFLKLVTKSWFTWKAYLIIQYLGSLLALILFYNLLSCLKYSKIKSSLAVAALAFSPAFLRNSFDGEEFIFGLSCVIASMYFLTRATKKEKLPFSTNIILSSLIFALGTGFRPESVFILFIYPIFLFFQDRHEAVINSLKLLVFQLLIIFVVWLPIFIARSPLVAYPLNLDFKARLIAYGYKLIFQAFSLPVFFVICLVAFFAIKDYFVILKRIEGPEKRFVFTAGIAVILIVFSLFFLYPSKPSFLLVTVPFIIMTILLLGRDYLFYGLVSLTLISNAITLDVVKDRKFVGFFLNKGIYFQATIDKPKYKLSYIKNVLLNDFGGKSIVVLDCSPGAIAYNLKDIERVMPIRDVQQLTNEKIAAIYAQDNIYYTGDILYKTDQLKEYIKDGYKIMVDKSLFKRRNFRYSVFKDLPDTLEIEGIRYNFFYSSL